jgi:threonylcarbamoyladenosine tRNA methylthiotransferase MtaB
MSGPEIITLGCRLNIAESETMRTLAGEQDDLVIVNSCAVTNEAVRQTRQAIRRARRARPDARILVTGCAAQTDPAMFAAMPEVDSVVGNREKFDLSSFRRKPESPEEETLRKPAEIPAFAGMTEDESKIQVSDIMAVRETAPHLVSGFADHARAFVEVQNGCDHRCTFCIIPYGRGNSRSVPAGAVIDKIKALVDAGYREVVLTGVDVTSYGPDLPGKPTLGLLIERILDRVPELPRLRLSSLDSVEVDERMFDLITRNERIMPHLHLSLQAGDNMILKRMKRRHNREKAIALVERIKAARPEIAIGADIIAGFPTETEAMFDNSLRLVADCDIVYGHVFPFSPRTGTPAARMPQLAPAVIKERAARLRAACDARKGRWLASLKGARQKVLVERDGRSGHAENFAPVRFATAQKPGEIVSADIIGLEKNRLIAQEAL